MIPRALVCSLSLFMFLLCQENVGAQVVFRDTTAVQTAQKVKPQFALGLGFGYAAPRELNDRIRQEITSRWVVSGSTDLNVYVVADAALLFPLNERWYAGPLLEAAVASKSFQDISAGMDRSVYSLWRFSPGAALQFVVPLNNAYWYFAPAVQYHSLKYNSLLGKDLRDKSLGLRLEAGYAMQAWTYDLRYKATATFMSMKAGEPGVDPSLNFSGLALGIGISFP